MMFFAPLKMMLLPMVAMMRCLPSCAVRHTSLGVAVIIGVANIICRRQTSFKKRTFVLVDKCSFFVGGERGIRTLVRVLAETRFPVVRLRPAQPSLQTRSLVHLAVLLLHFGDFNIILHFFLFVKGFLKKSLKKLFSSFWVPFGRMLWLTLELFSATVMSYL